MGPGCNSTIWLGIIAVTPKDMLLLFIPDGAQSRRSISPLPCKKAISGFLSTSFVALKNDLCNLECVSCHFQQLKIPFHYQENDS